MGGIASCESPTGGGPNGLHNAPGNMEHTNAEGRKVLEQGPRHVKVIRATAGAAINDLGVNRLATGIYLNMLSAIASTGLIIETLGDSNDEVTAFVCPAAITEASIVPGSPASMCGALLQFPNFFRYRSSDDGKDERDQSKEYQG